MSPLARRLVTRLVLAVGVGLGVALVTRDCDHRERELTLVVDPRPVGEAIRALRVDVTEGTRSLGGIEREFAPGEPRRPVTLRTAAPEGPIEVTIELDTSAGSRRVRRTATAAPGGKVTISIDGLEPAPATR